MRSPISKVAVVAGLIAIAACSAGTGPAECTGATAVTPDTAMMVVGDTLTFHVDFDHATCLPSDTGLAYRRWSIIGPDTTVAVIDSLSGLVTAENLGTARAELRTALTRTTIVAPWIVVHP